MKRSSPYAQKPQRCFGFVTRAYDTATCNTHLVINSCITTMKDFTALADSPRNASEVQVGKHSAGTAPRVHQTDFESSHM